MEKINFIEILTTIFSGLIQLTVIAFCIYYIAKHKGIEGILLLIGSFMSLLVRPVSYIYYNFIFTGSDFNYEGLMLFNDIIMIYGVVSYAIFSTGLIMVIVKAVKNKSS